MSQNNGLGRLTHKNTVLWNQVTEKVAAVLHSNGTDIWIIAHERENSKFCSFLLTPDSISQTPVICNVGIAHTGGAYNYIGYLKASPSGNYLACVVNGKDKLQLFDFDNSSGVIENPITFDSLYHPYGVEFSPNESRLYTGNCVLNEPRIFQYDLTAGTPEEIANSRQDLTGIINTAPGAFQLGPDQKIYIAMHVVDYLGVINNPNELGDDCNIDEYGFYLTSGISAMGLPNLMQSYFVPKIQYQNTCYSDTTDFWITSLSTTQSVIWNFGDTASGSNNTSTLDQPGHVFSSSGIFNVTATVSEDTLVWIYSVDVKIDPTPDSALFIIATDSVCTGSQNVLYSIATVPYADSVAWNLSPDSAGVVMGSDSIIHIDFSPSFSGLAILSVHSVNECGNGDTVSINIDVIGDPVADAGPSALICPGSSHVLNGSATNYNISVWTSTGDGSFDDPFNLNATYFHGQEDSIKGHVYLVLYATANYPCTGIDGDTMLIEFRSMPYQPPLPVGPTQIFNEPGLTSDYYTNTVKYANEYAWSLNPIESGLVTWIDTTATVSWNQIYSGLEAYLHVNAINDCGETSSDTLVINFSPVDLDESFRNTDEITIWPNPSKGIFNIKIASGSNKIDLKIYNSYGTEIMQFAINPSGIANTIKIDLSDQALGSYYFHFIFDEWRVVKKVLVHRN